MADETGGDTYEGVEVNDDFDISVDPVERFDSLYREARENARLRALPVDHPALVSTAATTALHEPGADSDDYASLLVVAANALDALPHDKVTEYAEGVRDEINTELQIINEIGRYRDEAPAPTRLPDGPQGTTDYTITVRGRGEMPQDDPRSVGVDTYTTDLSELYVHRGDARSALEAAESVANGEHREHTDVGQVHSAKTVEVRDQSSGDTLRGVYGPQPDVSEGYGPSTVHWPRGRDDTMVERAQELRTQAGIESSWDNFETARKLREQATRIEVVYSDVPGNALSLEARKVSAQHDQMARGERARSLEPPEHWQRLAADAEAHGHGVEAADSEQRGRSQGRTP